jgi:hypothetical protein
MPVPEPRSQLVTGPSLCLGLALLLSACAPLPPKPEIREVRIEVPVPMPVVRPADAAAQQLLAQHERLLKLTPAELAQEVVPREDAKLDPAAATQLALALSLNRGNGDLARAAGLLEQVLHSGAPEAQPWLELARLLLGRVAEQRRLEDQIEKLNQQARDSQRDNQRRLDQLNEKLEALKAIERSLNARPAPAATKP